MPTIQEVADHFGLTSATVRRRIKAGDLHASKMRRNYRVAWQDIWACEQGPLPKGPAQTRYAHPLISKAQLACAGEVSVRTVERWLADGLPTRNVFGSVRMNPDDVRDWVKHHVGFEIPMDRLRETEE